MEGNAPEALILVVGGLIASVAYLVWRVRTRRQLGSRRYVLSKNAGRALLAKLPGFEVRSPGKMFSLEGLSLAGKLPDGTSATLSVELHSQISLQGEGWGIARPYVVFELPTKFEELAQLHHSFKDHVVVVNSVLLPKGLEALLREVMHDTQATKLELVRAKGGGGTVQATIRADLLEPEECLGVFEHLSRLNGKAPLEAAPLVTAVLAKAAGRCSFCHDDLKAGQDLRSCGACETVIHEGCWVELRRCPTLGCGSRTSRRVADSPLRL